MTGRFGIYAVDDGGATYWLIAVGEKAACDKIRAHLEDIGCLDDVEELTARRVEDQTRLTFCADRLPISHTAEEWLVIYDGCCCEPYIACSEF